MEKFKKITDTKSHNVIFQKSEIRQNLNLISKNIIKKLNQDPQYESVSMNQVKKIINDNFITPEEDHISNSIILRRFFTATKEIKNDTCNEETDTDSFKDVKMQSNLLSQMQLPIDQKLFPFVMSEIDRKKFQYTALPSRRKSTSSVQTKTKYLLKNLSRTNKIIRDSMKLKMLKMPYKDEENTSILERVGFPQRKEKNKKDYARISFFIKKKFDKEFQEQNDSFLNYIKQQSTNKDKIDSLTEENCYEDYTNGDVVTNPSSFRNKTVYNSLFVKKKTLNKNNLSIDLQRNQTSMKK